VGVEYIKYFVFGKFRVKIQDLKQDIQRVFVASISPSKKPTYYSLPQIWALLLPLVYFAIYIY
jgi:hypothetical protein